MENKSKKNKILLATLIPASLLLVGGAGIGIGYAIWHKTYNPDITYNLSLEQGANNELSSLIAGSTNNIVKVSASFNKSIWWAGIYLTSGDEEIFEDGYVQYSKDGGSTWLHTSPDVGVYFWNDHYQSSGIIEFKLMKLYPSIKLVHFKLSYCQKQGEPAVETEESIPILFSNRNASLSTETIENVEFPLWTKANGLVPKVDFINMLNTKLGSLFTSTSLPTQEPASGEAAANILNQSINGGGISNAASIAALIACENWEVLNTLATTDTVFNDTKYTLEISFLNKNNNDSLFDFQFNQHWTSATNGGEVAIGSGFITNIQNCKYVGVREGFGDLDSSSKSFEKTYLTVDTTINNKTGLIIETTQRDAKLGSITNDLAKTIYKGTGDFPTWMFPSL